MENIKKIENLIKNKEIDLAIQLMEATNTKTYFENFYKNCLKIFEVDLLGLFKIEKIYCNNDKNFDSAILSLPNLVHLHISNTKNLVNFTDCVSNVVDIELYDCNVEISDKFLAPNLGIITINRTNIKEIPKFIFACENLSILNLRYNNISVINSEINKLKNLSCLMLANNPIQTLEPIINLPNLKVLDITNTKIDINAEQNIISNINPGYLTKRVHILGNYFTS